MLNNSHSFRCCTGFFYFNCQNLNELIPFDPIWSQHIPDDAPIDPGIPPGLRGLRAFGGNQGLLGVASHDALRIRGQRGWCYGIISAQKFTWGHPEHDRIRAMMPLRRRWMDCFPGILREIILKHTVYTNIHQLIVEVSSKCFFLSLKAISGNDDTIWHYDMHREKLQHWKRTWRKIAQGWLT